MKYILSCNLLWEPNKDGRETILIEEYMENLSQELNLPWHCLFEILGGIKDVTFMHCKGGNEEKWQKILFRHLTAYRGDPALRLSVRRKGKPPTSGKFPNKIESR